MAAAPVKSQPFHNFSLSFPSWGAHGGSAATATATATAESQPSNRRENHPEPDRVVPNRVGSRSSRLQRYSFSFLAPSSIETLRSSVPEDRSLMRPRIEVADVRSNEAEEGAEGEEEEREGEEEDEKVQRPWNLRPRKAQKNGIVSPKMISGGNSGAHEARHRAIGSEPKSVRLRGLAMDSAVSSGGERKNEKARLWIALSRDEIEEDIFIMTGNRPARRPKRRPKNVQKQLDSVFPGLWLVGTTADSYKVPDSPVKK